MEISMPRKALPARLWLEPARYGRNGKLLQNATWCILDRGKKHGTGCGADDREGAEKALQTYLVAQHSNAPIPKGRTASEVAIGDVLRHYVETKGTGENAVASTTELGRRAEELLGFWGEMTLDDIDSSTCRRYVEHRRPSVGSARRELEDLRAAVNLAIADKLCREAVKITLPKKPSSRKGHLERDAAARLIWHAYRKREVQTIHRGPRKGEKVTTSRRPTLHLARFILFAMYTGTRSKRVWMSSFERREGHPWIDVENGVYYREAPGESAAANKNAPSIRLPGRLVAHLRRWKSGGGDPTKATTFLCEYRKGRPGDTKKAFARLVDELLKDEGSDIVRHSLRHTAATWLLQDARDPHRVAGYLGMRTDVLIKVYGHHHPDYQDDIGESFTSGRAGRRSKGKAA